MKYVLYTYGKENPKQKALKLHQQFGRPARTKLLKLIKEAGIKDEKLEDEIEKLENTVKPALS